MNPALWVASTPAWLARCSRRVLTAVWYQFGRHDITIDELGAVPHCEWFKHKGVGRLTVKDIREVLARRGVAMAGCPHRLHGDGT